MIYVFQSLLKTQEFDLNKSFDSLQTSPGISQQVQHINKLRDNFYKTFSEIESKPMNETNNSLEWMQLFEYLNLGVELLNIGVKNANFPFTFNYNSFTFPSKTINISDGNSIIYF